MDGLILPHLWEIYENPQISTQRLRPMCLKPGLALLTLLIWSNAAQAWASRAYINTPVGYALNLRWGPGIRYGIYQALLRGTPIDITGTYRDGWAQLTNGTWVAGNFISSTSPFVSGTRTEAVVASDISGLNARWGPGTNFGIYRRLAPGERVILTGMRTNGWAQLNNGTWVAANYLRSVQAAPEPSEEPANPSQTVVRLQDRLKVLGYLPSDFPSTGVYDANTQAAVRRFQQNNGLPANGIVDDATWQALYRDPPQSSPPVVSPSPTMNPTQPPLDGETPSNGEQRARIVADLPEGETVRVFDGPGSEYDIIDNLPNGSEVILNGRESGNWSQLQSGGWVFSMWVQPI